MNQVPCGTAKHSFSESSLTAQHYAEVRRKSTFRSLARRAALTGLGLAAWAADDRAFESRPRVQVLYLHHVFDDEIAPFRRLLALLSKKWKFVSYQKAVDLIQGERVQERLLAFSFDDGIRNCLSAASVLEEFGASGCFFVCPKFADERSPEQVADFSGRIGMPPVEFLSWEDIETLLRRGHEIGNHTLQHRRLSRLTPAELEDDLGISLDRLNRRVGKIKHFAWPYGRFSDFSSKAAGLVGAAGYTSCASAERGCHLGAHGPRPVCQGIRRDHILAADPPWHSMAFLAINARVRAVSAKDALPAGWF
jgi:peptidoglycan/xylan/chitin deacetylase (PgdA/CDA1 family)